MQLTLSDEDARFREEAQRFFATEIPAEIRSRGLTGRSKMPDDTISAQRILNAHGRAVPNWPLEWGGTAWTASQKQIWFDEMQLAGVPEPLGFNTKMVGPVIAQFGSEELKRRFLPPTANLDIWWCQGFSEPEAGSDLASLRTTAVRDGDTYIVNGQKTWTTLGQFADWIFLLVRTNPGAPKKQAGLSFLLVEMSSPGITVRPIRLIDGSYDVNEVFFDDVRVPSDHLVGEENLGWTYAKFLLGNERTGIAKVGLTKLWLAQVKERASRTHLDGTTLISEPVFASRVAEAENDLMALELTQMRVSGSGADGRPSPVSSILKLRGTQLQQAATELLLEAAGSDALPFEAYDDVDAPSWAQDAAPRYLNHRAASIYGGSSEIQRTIIASTILGL
ncbi:acyl-CoA dehydrogenase family protein [Rhodococcoides fascians]|uniref:acyl-CoA dehydrogenase family protein n=1 Tax=Rhodococcoides fascians TaxID=1828 RepID=UPI0005697B67|nr:acyl-CoA dehydrogenase family protein [Rhodococcus fascians]